MLEATSFIEKENGTTLVELLVYMVLIVLIISGAYTIYEGSAAIYASSSSQADAQRSGRLAQTQMTRDIRMTQSFVTADDYTIDIRADINDDNLWEDVSYYVQKDSSNIYHLYKKENGGAAIELASGVQNVALNKPLFIYYDLHDSAITTDTASRKTKTCEVEINLIIDTDINNPPGAYTLDSKVTLRNK